MEEPTLHVIDSAGEEFMAQAKTETAVELNGDQTLSVTFEDTELNSRFLGNLNETFKIGGVEGPADEKTWQVTLYRMTSSMNKRYLIVQARLSFIDYMDTTRVYERYDQSLTAAAFMELIFAGTPYQYALIDSFSSLNWEGLGDGETKLSMIQRGIDRYEMDFNLVGTRADFHALFERNQPFIMHRNLNASNIQKEADATGFWTYARGYGDYDNAADEDGGVEEKANLKREYISPLASIPGIGRRHAPPYKNGKMTLTSSMDTLLENLVEQSVVISLTTSFYQLKDYPYSDPRVADVTELIDDVIGLNVKTRVVKVVTTRNAVGEITDIQVTLGGRTVTERHRASLNAAAKFFDDLDKGRTTLPMSYLPAAQQLATEMLLGVRTELEFGTMGILAVDKNNANNVVLFNAAGIGISNDGGQTFENALTGAGLVANVITSGDIFTNQVRIVGEENYFTWDANGLIAIDPDNTDSRVWFSSDGLKISNDGGLTWETRIDGQKVVANIVEGAIIRTSRFEGLTGDHIWLGVNGAQLDTYSDPDSGFNRMRLKASQTDYVAVDDNHRISFYLGGGAPSFIFFNTDDGHYQINSGQVSLKFLDGSLSRIQARKGDGEYAAFEASEFITISREATKKNITPAEDGALEKVMSTPILNWHRLGEDDREMKHIGPVYENAPCEIVDPGGAGISDSASTFFQWKALQEFHAIYEAKIKEMQDQIDELKNT